MAITFVGAASASNVAGSRAGDLTCNVPAGVQDGDLLLAFWHKWDNDTITPPAGWTQLGTERGTNPTDQHHGSQVWWRIASSEPASYFWDISGSWTNGIAQLAFRGVDTSGADPFDDWASQGFSVTSSAITGPSVTSTVDGAIVTYIAGFTNDVDDEADYTTSDAGTLALNFGEEEFNDANSGAVFYHLSQSAGAHAYSATPDRQVEEATMWTLALPASVDQVSGTVDITAPLAQVSLVADVETPEGSIDATAPSAQLSLTGEIVANILAVTAPFPQVDLAGGYAGGPLALTAPFAQVSMEGSYVGGPLALTAPFPSLLIGVETRIFGRRVIVPDNDFNNRVLEVPRDQPPETFYV